MSNDTLLLILLAIVVAAIVGFWLGRSASRRAERPGSAPQPVPTALPGATARRPEVAGPLPGPMDPSPDGAPEPAGSDPRPDEAPRGRGTTDRKGRERTATQSGHRRDERPPARPTSASGDASSTAMLLGKARSWGYQLQKLSLARAADSPFDILVIDPTKDGDDESALKPAEVERLKRKTDGSRRIVLAYLSIGEAESYRSYWRKDWKRNPPDWLLRENPEWEENYAVCFWNEGWQDILCGSRGACLDRILAQGFDGIYLDKCDVTEDLKQHEKAAARTRKDLDGDMVALVQRLATYARERLPGFLVVMQNAEPLLERPELRRIIDASAKEELLFGLDKPEKPNDRDEIDWSRERLDLMRRDGKPVLLVEYLEDRAKITKAAEEARRLGYVLYVSTRNRELDKLVYTTLEA